MEEIDKIKKLLPEERIDKLKELEKKRKKEIQEAEELIKQSVDEIQKQQEIIEQVEVPSVGQDGVKKLGEDDEDLEKKVSGDELRLSREEVEQHTQYSVGLSKEPVSELYNKVKDIYQTIKQTGEMTSEQQNAVNDFNYAVQYKAEDINKGAYETPGEAVSNIISASKQIINYMRGR